MLICKCDFCKKDIDRYHTLYHLRDVNQYMSKYSTLDICSECLDYLTQILNKKGELSDE